MDVCNSSWDELSLVIVADLVQWFPWGGFLVFSMAAQYNWLQLSTPNKPCRGVRQSLVFVIMASNWGFLPSGPWWRWDFGVCQLVFVGLGGCVPLDGGSCGWIVMATLRRCCWFVGLCFTMDGCSCIGLLLVVHQSIFFRGFFTEHVFLFLLFSKKN